MNTRDQMKKAANALVSFDEHDWLRMSSCITPKTLPKGQFVIRAGEVARYVGFVKRGCLRGFYDHDGREHTVNFFLEGDFFADCEHLARRDPSAMSVQAVEPSELLLITVDDIQRLQQELPAAEALGRRIAELHFAHERRRVTSLLADSAEKRYLDLLERQPALLQRAPQYMLASYLGITPETLSRIRRRLTQSIQSSERRHQNIRTYS